MTDPRRTTPLHDADKGETRPEDAVTSGAGKKDDEPATGGEGAAGAGGPGGFGTGSER